MKNKTAFTLAEATIILSLLGLVAAIVIPSTVNSYNRSVNRTKMKQALETYNSVMKSIIFDQKAVKSGNLDSTCPNNWQYFNVISTIDQNGCVFKTSNNVWWDITDISKPIVAVSEKALAEAQDSNKGTNGKTSFQFTTSYDNKRHIFRINDLIYEKKRIDAANDKDDEDDEEKLTDDEKNKINKNIEELENLYKELGIEYYKKDKEKE